jgi:hypothetical protein
MNWKPPHVDDIFPGIPKEQTKVFVIGADDCYLDRESDRTGWAQLIGEDRLRYFCNEAWPTKREIAFRFLRIVPTFTGYPGIVRNIRNVLFNDIDAGFHVLVTGYCYGGLIASMVADEASAVATKNNKSEVLTKVAVVTFGALYLSPSVTCTHYVFKGDISNKFNGIAGIIRGRAPAVASDGRVYPLVYKALRRRRDTIVYIPFSDSVVKAQGAWGIHELYQELHDHTVVHMTYPDAAGYTFCFAKGSFTPGSAERLGITCYDFKGEKRQNRLPFPSPSSSWEVVTNSGRKSSRGSMRKKSNVSRPR